MSERGQFRGGRGGGGARGRGGGGQTGRGGGAGGGGGNQAQTERKNILNLDKYMSKKILVKFSGGREVTGILRGYDQLMNLTLDEVEETMHDAQGNTKTRKLGLLVARGTLLVLIAPTDGSEEIENPFIQQDEDAPVVLTREDPEAFV